MSVQLSCGRWCLCFVDVVVVVRVVQNAVFPDHSNVFYCNPDISIINHFFDLT